MSAGGRDEGGEEGERVVVVERGVVEVEILMDCILECISQDLLADLAWEGGV